MREILAGCLWLGNVGDARNMDGILSAGIVAVIDLALEDLTPVLTRSMIYCRFPIADGEQGAVPVLRTAIETVASLIRKGVPTLVYCGAGMSRSPAVVAAALSIVEGGSPEERLEQVVAGHPHDVSPQLWQAVREACSRKEGPPCG